VTSRGEQAARCRRQMNAPARGSSRRPNAAAHTPPHRWRDSSPPCMTGPASGPSSRHKVSTVSPSPRSAPSLTAQASRGAGPSLPDNGAAQSKRQQSRAVDPLTGRSACDDLSRVAAPGSRTWGRRRLALARVCGCPRRRGVGWVSPGLAVASNRDPVGRASSGSAGVSRSGGAASQRCCPAPSRARAS
jgi:hypothetical protein